MPLQGFVGKYCGRMSKNKRYNGVMVNLFLKRNTSYDKRLNGFGKERKLRVPNTAPSFVEIHTTINIPLHYFLLQQMWLKAKEQKES